MSEGPRVYTLPEGYGWEELHKQNGTLWVEEAIGYQYIFFESKGRWFLVAKKELERET